MRVLIADRLAPLVLDRLEAAGCAVAIESGIDPIVLTVPITFAASCAFMLPVATPPNAIVFGSGMLTIPKMVRAGMMLNIVGIFVVSLVALYLAPKFL